MSGMKLREQFEKVWYRIKGHEEEQLKVPNDWPWEKRCSYWVWLQVSQEPAGDALRAPPRAKAMIPKGEKNKK